VIKQIHFILFLILLTFILLTIKINNSFVVNAPFKTIDGDTVKKQNLSFRFKSVDAPELHGYKNSQLNKINNISCLHYYAIQATRYVMLFEDKMYLKCNGEKGIYNRYLCIPYYDHKDLRWDLVKNGLAFCYTKDKLDPSTWLCMYYQLYAKWNKRGMWKCE